MPPIARDNRLDSTLALHRDPYRFISAQCRKLDADLFRCRILLEETICMTGAEAARVFYDTSRFARAGAAPPRLQKTLFGKGGVQGLDDEAHRHRKGMLMSLLTPQRIGPLIDGAVEHWTAWAARFAVGGGGAGERRALYPEAQEVLCKAVCAWAGVALADDEVKQRTRQLAALFDGAGAVGPRHWQARRQRSAAERWIEGVVEQVRGGEVKPPDESPLGVIAQHADHRGELVPARIAAVELLNILRPTVAVAVYFTFIAHALHAHPRWRDRLREERPEEGGPDPAELFVQEVRRWYPFFPATAARAREEFDWNGYTLRKGARVLLDLYGTNHDSRLWEAPGEFRPERFADWSGDPFTLIPQGGGDHYHDHRCAGEWLTIELMKRTARFLAGSIEYTVPEQDLSIDLQRLPALPRDRFLITDVRLIESAG